MNPSSGGDSFFTNDQNLEELAKAISQDPSAAKLVLFGAQKRRDWRSVIKGCTEALANLKLSSEDTCFFLELLAEAHLESGEYAFCVAECTTALSIEGNTNVLISRMRAFRRLGRYPEALADCDAAIARAKSDDQRQAIEEYRQRIVLSSQNRD